jgi:hypothetical protein
MHRTRKPPDQHPHHSAKKQRRHRRPTQDKVPFTTEVSPSLTGQQIESLALFWFSAKHRLFLANNQPRYKRQCPNLIVAAVSDRRLIIFNSAPRRSPTAATIRIFEIKALRYKPGACRRGKFR